jgi:hypothetical protein
VYVGRQVIGHIKGANTNKPNDGTGTRVVTPYGDPTLRAAGDLLAFSALSGGVDDFRLRTQIHYAIRLNHCIQCK